MTILRRLYFRLIKNIEVYSVSNIQFGDNVTLNNGSIINANNGNIILGSHTRIGNSTELVVAKNHQIEIKDFSTLYSNCKVLGSVTIERYCVLATNIYMSSGNHFAFKHPELLIRTQDSIERNEGTDINKPIHIHEDVWVGNGVFISNGITIGRGAVIGAGTIVTKDIEPYQVVVGNPGKAIKTRLLFSPPEKINAQNRKDWPYFYQGFNHKLAYPNQNKKGFQIIDHCVIYLQSGAKSINISGFAISKNTLTLTISNICYTQKIPKGEFNIQINLEKVVKTNYTIISISKPITTVYINSVQSNT